MNPQKIRVARLTASDTEEAREIIRLFVEVFELLPDEQPKNFSHLENQLADPDFFCYSAAVDQQVVGGLTAYLLSSFYDGEPELMIYDVGVQKEFRRRGIGQMMIQALLKECVDRDITSVFVDAHADDIQALDFYRSMEAAAEEAVIQFTFMS